MKMLIAMTMMMLLVQVAVAEEEFNIEDYGELAFPKDAVEEVKYPKVWLLVMVSGDGDMQEWTRHVLWSSCVSKGTKELDRHLRLEPFGELDRQDDPVNPFRYNGFFCDRDMPKPKPEPVSMLMPKCLSPMKECA